MQRDYYYRNRDKMLAKGRKFYDKGKTEDPDFMTKKVVKNKHYRLKKLFGLTPESWDDLFESQGRKCSICKSDQTSGKDWHTDHDHATNKLRGILCYHCNLLLGMARDSTDILKEAVVYLEKHQNGK